MLATNGRVRWELELEGVDAELKPKRQPNGCALSAD